MFERVDSALDIVKLEHQILDFWKRTEAFEKLRSLRRGAPPWSFLDGPITANNPMGVHHAWGRTYKDCYQRYFAMTGHDERWQNGFDCQGLWVEVEVEKELGFRSKKEIEAYGLERFIEQCKERVRKYAAIQTEQSIRLGMWMDWPNSYYTMSEENNYAIWSFLKKCHQQGLIYKGMDSMPWCPRCGTGISEQERKEGYRKVDDLALFVRFPLRPPAPDPRPPAPEYLLVWTTTPWTLPANVACAVNPYLTYAKVRQPAAGGDVYYLSQECLHVLKERGPYEVLEEFSGQALVGRTYDGPFDELPAAAVAREAHRVIPWSEVVATEGTGLVHIAPGCGKEDFQLGKEQSLPVLAPIDEEGVYSADYGFLGGRRAAEVADAVQESLRSKGLYYKREIYTHDYPHCWRCGTALLFRAVSEWYINMSWRDRIKRLVDQARWIPEWGRDQEHDWLNNMGDWMISKKRYWGLALPIFECSCGSFDVIGSLEEFRARAVEGWEEFEGHSPHRPWVDRVKIRCQKCGAPVSRIPDVGNPWLDAGIVTYSTVHYFTDREYWKKWIPADLVLESFPGQFRNWFYALLAMSAMMEPEIKPFHTLVGYALVKDEKGEEMHKSKGNAIWFDEAADRMGVDVMRWIFCRQTLTDNLHFGWGIGEQVKRKFFRAWWNVYAFFVQYAKADGFDPRAPAVPFDERPDIDRWLLTKLQKLIRVARARIPEYDVATPSRAAEDFVEDLSNWYVRRNRRRFWRPRSADDRDKLAAYQTLYETLVALAKLLAPIVPFVTEAMYQNLVRDVDHAAPESVHHCLYPEPNAAWTDEEATRDMDVALRVVKMALSIREARQVRVRQPLMRLAVVPRNPEEARALGRYEAVVLDELNVKSLEFLEKASALVEYRVRENRKTLGPRLGKRLGAVGESLQALDPATVATLVQAGQPVSVSLDSEQILLQPEDILVEQKTRDHVATAEEAGLIVALDLELTPELKQEGLARDLVRHIQQLRKDSGLDISDRIIIRYQTHDDPVRRVFVDFGDYIRGETLCVRLDPATCSNGREIKLPEGSVRVELEKV